MRETLARLDAASAAAADPLRPQVMKGPFASLKAWCAMNSKGKREAEAADEDCPASAQGYDAELVKPAPPWRAVQVFTKSAFDYDCSLALNTDRGWFVLPDYFYCNDSSHLGVSVAELAVRNLVPGKPPEVVLRVNQENMSRDHWEEDEDGEKRKHSALVTNSCDTMMIICGIGASKTPSCIRYTAADRVGSDCTQTPTWELSLDFKGGEVDVRAVGKPSIDAKAYTGRRPFVFP